MAKPLKQLITACWMSSPRLSNALIVESKRPGLRPQNMWIFTALPSLALTSTYTGSKSENVTEKFDKPTKHVLSILMATPPGNGTVTRDKSIQQPYNV